MPPKDYELSGFHAGSSIPPCIHRHYDPATTPETQAKLEAARKVGDWERIRKAKEKRERKGRA